jgi:hypothetical protein
VEWPTTVDRVRQQAAIQASIMLKPVLGHHIMDAIHRLYMKVIKKHQSLKLLIQWVPGHMEFPGNKAADEAAKDAAAGASSKKAWLPEYLKKLLPYSRTAAQQMIQAATDQIAQAIWEQSPCHGKVTKRLPALNQKFYRSLEILPQKHASIITQIVTGHIPLAAHLFKLQKVESPQCLACHKHNKTVEHFIMHGPVHNNA